LWEVAQADRQMTELVIICGTIVLLLSLTAIVVFPFLFVEYIGFRRSWIAVSPNMTPITLPQLPSGFIQFFDAVRPILEEAGFRIAVVAQAPAFGAGMVWWQVLMLDRATGERAAVTCLTKEHEAPAFDVALVIDCADGRRAASSLSELFKGVAQQDRVNLAAAAGQVRDLVARQRDRAMPLRTEGSCTPVMPAEGQELKWVESRVALIAAAMAQGRFERDASGEFYRPTRRYAMRLVIGGFRLTRPLRQRAPVPGFPVLTRE
jgi:hypothetical protein